MMYRYVNTVLESFSIVICVMLLAYQIFERRTNSKTNNWFTSMLVFNIMMLLGDLSDWVLGGLPGLLPRMAQYIFGIIGYFSASGLLLFSLYGWIISSISQKNRISSNWMRVGIGFSAAQVVLAVCMPIFKIAYIDSTNYYVRGNGFFLTQICPYIVYFLSMVLLFKYRKTFKKRELVYLGIFISIPLVAELIQVATYKYSALNVCISLGFILMFAFIQSQRDYDSQLQMKLLMEDENKKLEEMQSFQENLSGQLIEVLCGSVEAKDQYTRGHSLRVAQYAREIMFRLGGDEKAQQEAYYIGILHDVGKISVKDEIINKKGRLTDDEYEQIKLHTIAGYQILRGVDVIPNLAVGARWHHERYDGKGYPNGLAGENIPLVARIISVADAYDAMTSNRSYHKSMPQNVVRDEIEKGMGTQFDPKIAKIMLDMIDEDMQYEMKQVDFNRAKDILLIDDDPFSHTLVQHALVDENYNLTSAFSGKEGLELLKEFKFDVCLLDMEMPDMTGFEVLEWIQQNVHKLKVIFLTGDKEMATIKKSEALGARDYITKPINANVLRESINSVLIH